MEKETLIETGLTANEAEVYLALLKLGFALASEISTETKISRTHVYDTLNSLMKKGLVSFVIKSGKKYFRATSPIKFIELLKEKLKKIEQILPKLLALKPIKEEKPKIEIYEGKEGIQTVLEDIIKTGKEQLGFGKEGEADEKLKFYFPNWIKRRIKAKIKTRLLFTETDKAKLKEKLDFTKIKFLPKELDSPTNIVVYGDKVAIFLWTDTPMVILIENKEIARAYKDYFNLLWKKAKI